ncbi:hypothetical protein K491DRAFT_125434 [Lophiostoma macrostomum CBS 122681]|uniref:F-box domain-containing protein n=1 Tax=Lophiostoma macrostomum CBS 122681 TaxID=1314788 RepID=A0A6A6SS93_9PLEO|nr:hypothetical protein K491DRAFT_125434 [Lophiostoma macrostomum CBS 122681]
MESATSNVLGVPELLQNILSALPPLEILRMQRVCRTWKTLINTLPLLQYLSWMDSSYTRSHRVTSADTIPELTTKQKSSIFHGEYQDPDKQAEYEKKRFCHNMATHINPVLANFIIRHVPENPQFGFDVKWNDNGTSCEIRYSLRPDVLRECVKWYEKHGDAEERWGGMSLCRPDLKSVKWELLCSDDSSIPVELQADDGVGRLTLKDLMVRVDGLWKRWVNSEHETHYLSHDAGECDLDMGFPEHCLGSSDEGEDGSEDGEDGEGRIRIGTMRTVEEHLEQAIRNASR